MADRYWIGGTGNWDNSDTSHWSSSSGGSSGASVPTSTDNVFFDGNSFSADGQTVLVETIDFLPWTSGVICNDLTLVDISHVVVFNNRHNTGHDDSIIVYGSFTGSPNVTINARLTMNPPAGATVALDPFFSNLTYIILGGLTSGSGVTPQIVLLSDLDSPNFTTAKTELRIFGRLQFDANDLNLKLQYFQINQNEYNFNTYSTINMGSGIWNIKAIDGGGVVLDTTTLNTTVLNADTSTLVIDLSEFSGSQINFTSFSRSWTLNDVTIHGGSSGKIVRFDTSNLTMNTLLIQNPPVTIQLANQRTYTITNFSANGSSGNLITLISDASSQAIINSSNPSVSYVDVQWNKALGLIPFVDCPGGVDSGGNTNWEFNCNAFLQIIQMVGAETGKVQTMNAGKSDDGVPLYYELQTQELEFNNRAHLKKIADKVMVYTEDGEAGNFQANADNGNFQPIVDNLDEDIKIGEDLNLEGNFFTFKWLGNTSTSSPIFNGFSLEDVSDLGITDK